MRAVGHAQLKHHTGYEEERASYLLRARCARALRRSITVALVSVGLLFGMRFLILVLEAYTMISGERGADDDLVKLCRDGAARSSVHMRRACMGAEVDRASPVIVRFSAHAAARAARRAAAELVHICAGVDTRYNERSYDGRKGEAGFDDDDGRGWCGGAQQRLPAPHP